MTEQTPRERHLQQQVHTLTSRLGEVKATSDQLAETLKHARTQIMGLREDLDALASPPLTFGQVMHVVGDGTVDVSVAGRPRTSVMRTRSSGRKKWSSSCSCASLRAGITFSRVCRVWRTRC